MKLKNYLPFIYFLAGILLIIHGIKYFLADQEVYRIVFGFTTKNKYGYLAFRIIFGGLVILAGMKRWRDLKKSS